MSSITQSLIKTALDFKSRDPLLESNAKLVELFGCVLLCCLF